MLPDVVQDVARGKTVKSERRPTVGHTIKDYEAIKARLAPVNQLLQPGSAAVSSTDQ